MVATSPNRAFVAGRTTMLIAPGYARPARAIFRCASTARRLAGRGEEVVLMGFAPPARPGHRPGDEAPVVGEAGVAGAGRVGDDGAAPVVVGQDGPGDLAAPREREPVGVQEQMEPRERLALPGVGDVALVAERRPVPGGRRQVPDDAAR